MKIKKQNTPPADVLPAVSVVAPMYNVEKYVGECLESVLNQTFQNFEFIIVDDCSTDNSAKVVESYIPKFNGRLKLLHLKKNSGSIPKPLNTAIKFSRGKYIAYLDPDDMFTPDALETFYNVAEKFQADVVQAVNIYEISPPDNKPVLKTSKFSPDKATVEPADPGERLKRYYEGYYGGGVAWNKFYRRIGARRFARYAGRLRRR